MRRADPAAVSIWNVTFSLFDVGSIKSAFWGSRTSCSLECTQRKKALASKTSGVAVAATTLKHKPAFMFDGFTWARFAWHGARISAFAPIVLQNSL